MKKIRYILVGILLIVLNNPIQAKPDFPGLVHGGQYSKGILLSITQPDSIRQSSDTVYSVGTYPLYTPELAPGEGREAIQAYCDFCHSTTYITMQPPLPATIWETEVYKMINTYGAPIPEDLTRQIVAYLQRHYTPETRKK